MLRCNEKNPASLLYCSYPESNHEETLDKLKLRGIPHMDWPIQVSGLLKVKETLKDYLKLKMTREMAHISVLCLSVWIFFF